MTDTPKPKNMLYMAFGNGLDFVIRRDSDVYINVFDDKGNKIIIGPDTVIDILTKWIKE